MFEDMFKNGWGRLFGGSVAEVDPTGAMTDLQAANFMNFGTEPGQFPTFGQEMNLAANKLGNNVAQNQPMWGMAFQGAKGLFDTYNQFTQNKAMKDMLNFQKQAFNTNLAMTKKQTNMELSDRQRRRVSANPNAESVDSYMKKWGV